MRRKQPKPSTKLTDKEAAAVEGLPFDEVMRRVLRVKPPSKGRNEDYVEANQKADEARSG